MWSIIIYDLNNEKIIVSRDRFGEKPLFVYKDKDEIIFSSQINYINAGRRGPQASKQRYAS